MRLSADEIKIIKGTILKTVSDAKIMLFGSRVYDDKKGGDIDLFVDTDKEISLREQIGILTQMELQGIGRKVDLIVRTPLSREQKIFQTIAKEGVVL